MTDTRLLLFGPPCVEAGGQTHVMPVDRRTQLLVALALRPGWVPRSEIAALLWPEQPDRLAYTNVRKALHRLPELPWSAVLETEGHALRFASRCDVLEFDAAIREGRRRDALALRRGEALAGFDDPANEAWTQWLTQERDRLRASWRAAALDHVSASADVDECVGLSAQVLALDPFDETALRTHVQALLAAHQPARAHAAWQAFVDQLRRELGVEPSAELRAWHEHWTNADAGRAAPGRTASSSAPAPAPPGDGFVGRSAELHTLTALLKQGDVRWLTLLGPGGVGKTRLARRLLHELADEFPDSTFFVPCEDLGDATQIGTRVAQAIGLTLSSGSDALAQVAAAMQPRRTLLVLDNLEHLAPTLAPLARLIDGCPSLVVVATSRVRLPLAQEQLFALQGLPYPDPDDQDRLEAFDAARLFIRAARRVEPALVPAAEAPAIVEICRLVDGLPLALELAASWTRVMSCEAIAEELRRGTELLSTADPARPSRHASVAAVFEQSWSQLGDVERRALAALSLCRGGFTPEAARRVAGASPPVLAALADRSLLRKEPGGRLQMHPLVQQFAAEKLADGVVAAAAAAAHATHYLARLAALEQPLRRAEREALREVDIEFENVRAACAHAAQAGLVDVLGRSASSIRYYCDVRGRAAEGRTVLLASVDALPPGADARVMARLRAFAAHLLYRLGRYEPAIAEAQQVLSDPGGRDDPAARAQAQRVVGAGHLQLGRFDDALVHFHQAQREAEEAGDALASASMLDNVSIVEKHVGRFESSLSKSQAALALFRQLGARASIALCLSHQGSLQLLLGDPDRAQALLEDGLAISERDGLINPQGYLLGRLAEAALRRGLTDQARQFNERAQALARQHGFQHVLAWAVLQSADIALRRGDQAASRAALAGGFRMVVEQGDNPLLVAGLGLLAKWFDARGERAGARRVLAFAIAQPLSTAPDRLELQRQLDDLGGPLPGPAPAWALDDLARRVASEDVDAALVALLRESR